MTIDHVLLTRFNLPTPGPESFVRAQEGWLRNRAELFLRHTVPTVRAQTTTDFRWIIYFDRESPAWLVERFAPLVEEGLFVPLYRQEVGWQDVVDDVRTVSGARGDILLTTNLDNDDAVAVDFVERLQSAARRHVGAAIFLRTGLILQGDRLYLRDDRENAFCSVSESWESPLSAWRDWHTLLRNHFTVVSESGAPAWLQVIHGQNVSNTVHGRLADPARYRDLFPGQLHQLPAPTRSRRLKEAVIAGPIRESKSALRRAAKDVVLALLGKRGLDALKARREALRRV